MYPAKQAVEVCLLELCYTLDHVIRTLLWLLLFAEYYAVYNILFTFFCVVLHCMNVPSYICPLSCWSSRFLLFWHSSQSPMLQCGLHSLRRRVRCRGREIACPGEHHYLQSGRVTGAGDRVFCGSPTLPSTWYWKTFRFWLVRWLWNNIFLCL